MDSAGARAMGIWPCASSYCSRKSRLIIGREEKVDENDARREEIEREREGGVRVKKENTIRTNRRTKKGREANDESMGKWDRFWHNVSNIQIIPSNPPSLRVALFHRRGRGTAAAKPGSGPAPACPSAELDEEHLEPRRLLLPSLLLLSMATEAAAGVPCRVGEVFFWG